MLLSCSKLLGETVCKTVMATDSLSKWTFTPFLISQKKNGIEDGE